MSDVTGAVGPIEELDDWVLEFDGPHHTVEASWASLLALSSGEVGVRGHVAGGPGIDQFVLVDGAYGTAPDGLIRQLPGPGVTVADLDVAALDVGSRTARTGSPCRWRLDLRCGTVSSEGPEHGERTLRFVSLARPGVIVLTAEDRAPERSWPPPLSPPTVASGLASEYELATGSDQECHWVETASDRAVITAVAHQEVRRLPSARHLERIVAVRGGRDSQQASARTLLREARHAGYDRLLDEHRATWAARWKAADIEIEGDPGAQLAVRFALFHLLSCAQLDHSSGVGARGLTGLAYAGHVFWDTEVFVLPALAATVPQAARSLIWYRTERLDVARAAARERGLAGARYPWESADSGWDVTPTSTRDVEGRIVPIRTGEHAEHINADIAWAVHHVAQWTGELDRLDGDAIEMVRENARYWRARIRADAEGRGHLYGVIGPDEYHEVVDDNAYTNGMARWHLRWAATLARRAGDTDEAETFEAAADTLVDAFDPATGRHEQFAGYEDLEPLLIADLAELPIAADVLLGRERTRRTQVIKQPDVLMLHHLLPEMMPAGSLVADLDHYLPRTAHGSSLSPAICASLLARVGRPNDALAMFDIATRIDLDDLTGTTQGGLHLATMGGLWQAVVFGFAGIRPSDEGLRIDPQLPSRWRSCTIRVTFRGTPMRITVSHDEIGVDSPSPVRVVIGDRSMDAPVRVSMPKPGGGRR